MANIRTVSQDRYAAPNDTFESVADTHDGLGAQSAPKRRREPAKGFAGDQGRSAWLVFLLFFGVSSLAGAQTPSRAPVEQTPRVAGQAAPTPVSDMDARAIREQLRQVMQRYPPDLGRILRMDPTLMQSQEYMAQYPALAQFLATHPSIAHNPNFYFEFVRDTYDWNEPANAQTETARMWRNMMESIGVFCIFLTVSAFLAWMIRTFVDYRRWLRLSKIQTEVHNKILDRFSGTGELLAYIQSSAGRRFLESAPIPLDAGPRFVGAPFGRILWSIQAGVVVLVVGLGFEFVSGRVIPDVGQPLALIGVLAIALGLGLILSGIVSFGLSRRFGLLDPVPSPPQPDRHDSSPAL